MIEQEQQHEHEEETRISGFWSWAIILAFCACIVGWGLFNFYLIPDRPRQWNFHSLPDTPGASIYSTGQTPQEANAPSQIAPVPGAHRSTSGPAEIPQERPL